MRSASWIVALLLSSTAAFACDTDVTPPDNIQQFYPPGPIRRSETGTVTVELSVVFGEKHPHAVKLLKGSGFAQLDEAALKLARAFLIRTECLEGSVQRTVHFEREPDPPHDGSDFIGVDGYIWVED